MESPFVLSSSKRIIEEFAFDNLLFVEMLANDDKHR
jgi:hypothetical protein